MNSLINAASSVGEVIWGKSNTEDASGQEPPNETPAATAADIDHSAAPPFDPGNSIDTAPAPTTTALSQDSKGDGTPTAIPAPGNADQEVASPTEGAGPTKSDEPALATKEEVATTGPPAAAAAATEELKKPAEPAEPAKPAAQGAVTETAKDEAATKDDSSAPQASTPAKPAAPAVAATSTPGRGRSDSPASGSGTPSSGKRGLRTKLKEKLHIGSQSPSGRKKD